MGVASFGRAGRTALAVCLVVVLGACTGEEHLGPVPIQKSQIRIFPSTLDLDALAEISEFRAQRTDGQGRISNLNHFQWRSLSPNIAQVDGAGRVVSLQPGTATIEVTVNGERARAEVVVDQVPVHFAVGPKVDTLDALGQSYALSFEARDKNGFRIPRNSVNWESGNPNVVTVDDAGTVTSRGEGLASVRVRKRGRRDSTRVRVRKKANSITVLPRLDTLTSIGEQVHMRAYATNSDGNVVAEDGFTWTSSASGVATVTSGGVVEARSAGTADISATLGSLTGWARVVVDQSVENVTVTPANAAISGPGQTVQLSASGTDQQGGTVNSSYSWSSDHPSVATVDASGLVTGVGQGTARIVATASSGAKGFATVGVGAISLNVAPAADTLAAAGSTTQFAIYPRDASGSIATCPSPSWRSLNTTVADVNQVGQTLGKAVGTALIVVSACAVEDTASLVVLGSGSGGGGSTPPPGSASVVPPELPRAIPDTVAPAITRTVRASNVSQLQTAIANAQPGDEILLDPGVTYSATGGFRMPPRGDGGWVTIRTDLSGVSRSARVDSTLNFARLSCTGNNCAPIKINQGGDHGWRFEVLEVVPGPSLVNSAVMIHTGTTAVPDRLVFDRVYIHAAQPTYEVRRCILGNASNIAVLRSVLTECHERARDSQGFIAWNTPGPVMLYDNLIVASTINVLFGGADPQNASMVPSDITIARNHLYKPQAWKGGPWTVKNLFELKIGHRVHAWGNVLEGNWTQAQTGYCVLLKSTNQNGGFGDFSQTSDVYFERNIVRNCEKGFNLARDPEGPVLPMSRIAIENVVIEGLGRNGPNTPPEGAGMARNFLVQGPDDLMIRNITSMNPNVHSPMEFVSTQGNAVHVENLLMQGPTRYGLRKLPISQWYPTNRFVNAYVLNDNCANYTSGWYCGGTAPPGTGADMNAVSNATAGVRR